MVSALSVLHRIIPNARIYRDTVSSVGVVRNTTLPETTTGMTHVCVFRHALALDELRVRFLPEYANGGLTIYRKSDRGRGRNRGHVNSPEGKATEEYVPGHVKEVWFAGSHSDVYVSHISRV